MTLPASADDVRACLDAGSSDEAHLLAREARPRVTALLRLMDEGRLTVVPQGGVMDLTGIPDDLRWIAEVHSEEGYPRAVARRLRALADAIESGQVRAVPEQPENCARCEETGVNCPPHSTRPAEQPEPGTLAPLYLRSRRGDATVSLNPLRDELSITLTPDHPLDYGYEEAGTVLDAEQVERLRAWAAFAGPREPGQVEPGHGHDWRRTIPTDGLWCQRCGLAHARWRGDPCPSAGPREGGQPDPLNAAQDPQVIALVLARDINGRMEGPHWFRLTLANQTGITATEEQARALLDAVAALDAERAKPHAGAESVALPRLERAVRDALDAITGGAP